MLPDEEFNYIAQLLKQRSGLSLSKDKLYLLESRLQPIVRQHNLATLSALIAAIRRGNALLLHEVTQAMTTNETMFFRDNKPFERLRQTILPELLKNTARKHVRIWSAACSSGQEPYTMAICLSEEQSRQPGISFEIIASDLCEKMVAKAKDGLYTQFEVQRGMPIQLLLKYFAQGEENQWRANELLKKYIQFNVHNLLDDCSRFGKFDVIFCRNVLIYFDDETKRQVLARLHGALNPQGFLVLGSAETVLGLTDRYTQHQQERSIYQPR